MKKRFFSLVHCILCALFISAQGVDEVTLVVYGDGANKEEATHVALRSAIEQAYGTFVSANTSILNDSLVKDEIITVSSGNIQKYEEIAYLQLENGKSQVTLKATVSLNKLVRYAQNKGAECEFAGATFAANIKLYELYKENSQKALDNLLLQIENVNNLFDYEIEMGTPQVDGNPNNFKLRYCISVCANENTKYIMDLIYNTLSAIGITVSEAAPFSKMGYSFFWEYIVDRNLEQKQYVFPEYEHFEHPSNRYSESNKGDTLLFPINIDYPFAKNLDRIIWGKIKSNKIINNQGTVYPFGTRYYPLIWKGKTPSYDDVWGSNHKSGIILGQTLNSWGDITFIHVHSHIKNGFILGYIDEAIKLTREEIMNISKFTLVHEDGTPVSTPAKEPMESKKEIVSNTQQSTIVSTSEPSTNSTTDISSKVNDSVIPTLPKVTTNNIIDKMGNTPITSDSIYTLGEINAKDVLSATVAFQLNENYQDVHVKVLTSGDYKNKVDIHPLNQNFQELGDGYFNISYKRVPLLRDNKTCDLLCLKIDGLEGLKKVQDLPKLISIPIEVQYRYSKHNIISKTIWIQCTIK